MIAQAEALYTLQQIDLEIRKHRGRLDEIAQKLQDRQAIDKAQAEVDAAEEALKPLHKQARELEAEIESTTQKAKASEDRLYSGNVKNPKEMRDLQDEIAALKDKNDRLETQQIELMMTTEEAENRRDTAQAELERVTKEWEAEHAELLAEQEQLQARIAELQEERQNALQQVSADSLKEYDMLRPRKGGRPVALLQDGTCSICGVSQTKSIEQAVHRRESLVKCENCGRILTLK